MKLSSLSLVKYALAAVLTLLFGTAYSQYPATGNKMRLGWQTTGDGLVYRGAIADTSTLDPSGLNNAWMLLDTVSGNLYAYRIKAWRLVSGGGGGLTMPFDSVTFNINEGDASEQELKYSAEKGYLQYGGLDSVQIPLLPGIWYVRNDTSVTIPKGTVVRATGTLGASGRIKVKHMIADGSIPAMYVLGIAMHDIASGADGYVMTQGKIRQINTQAYSEGAVLYADVDTLGGLTQTEPTGSNLKLPIAFVVYSASNGTLAVRVSPGTYLRDLHDAYITSPVSNASLYYNTSESVWRDTTGAVLTSDTSVFARDFQISGTTNRLAMFTGANTVGNSNIYQNNNNIGIGVNPSYKFQMFFNNSVTGVQDTLMDLYSANWYPVGVRSRVSNQIANGSYAVIGEALNGHYQENVGVYGIATKSDISGPGVNIGVKGEVSGTYNANPTALGATYGGLFINNVRKTLSSGNFNIGLRVITDSAGTYGIYQNGFGANYFQGNVGIGTASPAHTLDISGETGITTNKINFASTNGGTGNPGSYISGEKLGNWGGRIDFYARDAAGALTKNIMSIEGSGGTGGGYVGIKTTTPARSLHINSADAIRIPAGTDAQRVLSGLGDANGDLRFSTTSNNLEWYQQSTGNWRQPVISASATGLGTDGRVFYAGANGLSAADDELRWDYTNNRLGIGITPTAPLHVSGGGLFTQTVQALNFTGASIANGTTANNVFSISGNTASTGNTATNANITFDVGNSAGTRAMTILNNGRVGIGTASPSEVLQVNGTARATRLVVNTSGQVATITNNYPTGTTGNNLFIGDGGQSLSGTSNQASSNTSIGTGALFSLTTGSINLAIGVNAMYSSTNANLNIAIGPNALRSSNTGLSGLTENMAIGLNSMYYNSNGYYNMALGTYSMQNNTSGYSNVAIGRAALFENTIGYANVAIGGGAGNNTSTAGVLNQTSNTSIYIGADTKAGANGNSNEIVIGYAAIGNGSNTTTIGNSSTTHTILQYGETLVGYSAAQDKGAYPLQVNGQIFATNATIATSDARLKENIEPLPSGLKEVMSLKPCIFDFRKDTGLNLSTDRQVGFIAQDVAATVQGTGYEKALVQEAGGNLALAETKLIPLLVKAIQEQQAQIEALKKEIEQLKNK